VHFAQGYAQSMAEAAAGNRPNKIVTSLLLHQVPMETKRATLTSAFAALRHGGELHVADYGAQKSPLMRFAFKQVQALDGNNNSRPHAEGRLPELIAEAGFVAVRENMSIPTPTGSISLYSALRP
jgi:hypothetical protein